MIRWAIVRTVLTKELREMLRDRRSLLVMFGLPLVLYPLVAIGIASLGQSRNDELSSAPARVVVENGAAAPQLLKTLADPQWSVRLRESAPADVGEALRSGDLDAVLVVPENAEARAVVGEAVQTTIRLDRSRTASAFVEKKIARALAAYQRWVQEQRLQRYSAPPAVLEPLKTETIDVAGGDKLFGSILAKLLPLLLLLTGMLGAFFPALNATTTERELGTLETLLVTPAGRLELLLAKGTLVLLSSLLASGLNVLSMSLVLLKTLSQVKGLSALSVSPGALALSYLAAVPALMFFSAIVLIVGLLARNFREANSFATPVMLLPLLSLPVSISEPAASHALLVTPVANTAVIIREVLTGNATFTAFALAFGSSCLYAVVVLSVAARVFASEQLVNPAWEPLSIRGMRRGKVGGARRLPPVDAAIGLGIVCLLLLFYLSLDPRKHQLLTIVAINELVVILAPTLLFAYLGRWDSRATFKLRTTAGPWWLAAVLLAIGLSPIVQWLGNWQQSVWPQDPERARLATEPLLNALRYHPLLIAAVVGLLAGVCEEMLFRGAIQSSVERRVPAWAAIGITALLFGAFHFDLHGLPIRTLLGILLGWIAWRSGSIFPAMLTHSLYDATTLALAAWQLHRAGGIDAAGGLGAEPKTDRWDVAVLSLGGLCLLMAIAVLWRTLRRRPVERPLETSSG